MGAWIIISREFARHGTFSGVRTDGLLISHPPLRQLSQPQQNLSAPQKRSAPRHGSPLSDPQTSLAAPQSSPLSHPQQNLNAFQRARNRP